MQIILTIILFVFFAFVFDMLRDKGDLRNMELDQKFSILVQEINDHAFQGRGEVTRLEQRSFNLYQGGKNQIINFFYGTGHLTINWKYKYFHQEVSHEKTYNNCRDITTEAQKPIAEDMIMEMEKVIFHHQSNILARESRM